MKLLDFTAEGLRFPDGTHSFRAAQSGAPHDVVLVTGPPTSGKTSFLLAIAALKEAFGPYGSPPDLRRLLRPGKNRGVLGATWLLSEDEAARAHLSAREQRTLVEFGPGAEKRTGDPSLRNVFTPFSRAPTLGKLELFPQNRGLRVDQWRFPHEPLSAAVEEGRRLRGDPDKYTSLRRALFDLVNEQAARVAEALGSRGIAVRADVPDLLAPFKHAIATMLPELRLTAVRLREGSVSLELLRRDGRTVTLEEVSASEEQALLFALAHGAMQFHHSVLLVDEPELHQHSAHHAELLLRLAKLGSGNQILAATGSEPLVARFPAEQVIDLGKAARGAVVK
ncbi:ATP-binding protein [Polyangium spumosum]|uniref:AAA+ ATPase domain-containing protein n=1 Tax=Polyangium spumosum TaxID=889282 RepID=A0A6N7Q3P9_9BACT|nr:ATP-binding protein [Polyangium spumosum]MRG97480.1 hypothetical protein [Polyangium spumosum]